jgi:hypothetical protein
MKRFIDESIHYPHRIVGVDRLAQSLRKERRLIAISPLTRRVQAMATKDYARLAPEQANTNERRKALYDGCWACRLWPGRY